MSFHLKRLCKAAIATLCFFSLVSCYTVRIVSTKGAPMPPNQFERDDWYRDKMVVEIDTVIKAGVTTDAVTFRVLKEGCETGKLFSVDYKNTFGGSLLYLVTFGNKRKVKLKYVCMKPEN